MSIVACGILEFQGMRPCSYAEFMSAQSSNTLREKKRNRPTTKPSKRKSAGLQEIMEPQQMANELHEFLYDLGVSETWNPPLQILERDVRALREDVFPIPTIYRKEGAV